MGNLGWYQILTTVAKKLGGPRRFIVATMTGGYAVFRTVEAVGRFTYHKVKDIRAEHLEKVKEYIVEKDAIDAQGLMFKKGDHFKVLESDGDAVLIELIGNRNNPYFVSGEFLKTISNFTESEFKQ